MNMLYIADFSLPDQVQCPGYQRNYQGTIESIVNYPHLYSRVDDQVSLEDRFVTVTLWITYFVSDLCSWIAQDTPNPDGVGSNERMPCISVCNMNSPGDYPDICMTNDLYFACWHSAGVAVTLQNNVLLRSDPTLLYAQWHPTFNDFNSVHINEKPICSVKCDGLLTDSSIFYR